MTRLIINPLSFRMSLRDRHQRMVVLARTHGIDTLCVETETELEMAIRGLTEDPPERLIVCAGDGTVQAVVTALATLSDQDRPELLVLGGGRTNYTARDVATHRRPEQLLAWAAKAGHDVPHSTRHSLIIRQDGQADRHGFFVAGARINDIIRDCHRYRSRGSGWLRRGHVSSAWRVSQLGLKAIFGQQNFPDHHFSINAGLPGQLTGSVRLLLLTTLEHPGAAVNPYAERNQGKIRISAVSTSAQRFWQRLPRMLRGRYHAAMTPEQGYLSGRSTGIEINGLSEICLDGQEHDYCPKTKISFLPGPAFKFIHP